MERISKLNSLQNMNNLILLGRYFMDIHYFRYNWIFIMLPMYIKHILMNLFSKYRVFYVYNVFCNVVEEWVLQYFYLRLYLDHDLARLLCMDV